MSVSVPQRLLPGKLPEAQRSSTRYLRLLRSALRWTILIALALGVWQLAAQLNVFGRDTLPGPLGVASQLWQDRSLYPQNTLTTLFEALPALVLASIVAIALGVLFCELPLVEGLLSAPTIGLLCAPPIALAPIFFVAFSPYFEKFALAGLSAFFPVLVATIAGMRGSDSRMLDVVRSSGGGRWVIVRKIKLPAAASSIASGIQIAAPAAMLGAILGEFAGGTSGLGVFMLNSLSQFNPARTWGAGAVATVVGAVGYLGVGVVRRAAFRGDAVALSTGSYVRSRAGGRWGRTSRTAVTVVSIGIVIGGWWLMIWVLGLQSYFVKSPADVFRFFFVDGGAPRAAVFAALWQTVPGALIGATLGMLVAYGVAALFIRSRFLESTVMPAALILQAVPLQAMAPLIVVVLGRGLLSTVMVAVMVTFFPAVVLIAFGLRDVPGPALEVFHALDASPLTVMRKLRSPAAMPKIFAAARITAPGALMGVLVAEYLASGEGIGYLITNARQDSDYASVWAATVLITLVSVLLYQLVGQVERWALARYSEAL